MSSDLPWHLPQDSLGGNCRTAMIATLDLFALTDHTHVTIDSFTAEIETVRRRGYALDLEEYHLDMIAIAVPVLDHNKRFFAALAVHGPKLRFDKETAVETLALLQTSARRISAILFATEG